jgi:ubiquinone/menaquinone biosynthesis C-methylase UbiE
VSARERDYLPAASWHVFTRLFDPLVAVTMRERTFRSKLCDQLLQGLPELATIVDVGAGTGTLAIGIAAKAPGAKVIGIDPDPEILDIAQAKPGAGRVEFKQGVAQELPLPDASTDRLVMSLVLHHLQPEDKRQALAEARRVLRADGRLHIADFGRPSGLLGRAGFLLVQLADGFANTSEHGVGRLPDLFGAEGFAPARRHSRLRTAFGSLELLSARPV